MTEPALQVWEAEVLERARSALVRAYAPYSNFRVGAALLTQDGRLFDGVNIENAAYPAGICAERAALAGAVTAGARAFALLAVVGDGTGPCTPCGLCRQALYEFAPDLGVLAAGADGAPARFVLGRDLLPYAFDSNT